MKENIVFNEEVLENMLNKIAAKYNIDREDKFFKDYQYKLSKNYGKVTLYFLDAKFNFSFLWYVKTKEYKEEKSNIRILNGKFYTPEQYEEHINNVKDKILITLNKELKETFEANQEHAFFNIDNFSVDIKKSKKKECEEFVIVKSKNPLFNRFEKSMNFLNYDVDRNRIDNIKFELNIQEFKYLFKDEIERTIVESLLPQNKEYLYIDLKNKKIEEPSRIVELALDCIDNNSYNLKLCDIVDDKISKQVSCAKSIRELVEDKIKNEAEDISVSINLQSYSLETEELIVLFALKATYKDNCINKSCQVKISSKDIEDKSTEEIACSVVEKLKERIDKQKVKIDEKIAKEYLCEQPIRDTIADLVYSPLYTEDALLVMSILNFAMSNKFFSNTSILQFLYGRKMSDYFNKTQGYGAFKGVKEEYISNVIEMLCEYDILYVDSFYKYGNYCTIFKMDKKAKKYISSLLSPDNVFDKPHPIYYFNKYSKTDRYRLCDIEELSEMLTNKQLVIYMEDIFKKQIKDSDDDIKEYVKTLYEIETDKNYKKHLGYICSIE